MRGCTTPGTNQLKFTPLEFETRGWLNQIYVPEMLKFTPLEFETKEYKRRHGAKN